MTLSKGIYGALLALTLIFSGCGGAAPAPTSTIAKVQEKGELVLGTSGNMTPMTRQLENGDVVGLDIDLANVMAAALKVKLTIKVMPLDQLATAVQPLDQRSDHEPDLPLTRHIRSDTTQR